MSNDESAADALAIGREKANEILARQRSLGRDWEMPYELGDTPSGAVRGCAGVAESR
jgi:hypothetical protein